MKHPKLIFFAVFLCKVMRKGCSFAIDKSILFHINRLILRCSVKLVFATRVLHEEVVVLVDSEGGSASVERQ